MKKLSKMMNDEDEEDEIVNGAESLLGINEKL
jgi:hypothetical protein